MKLFRRAYISDYVEFDIIFKLCFEMKDCYLKTVTWFIRIVENSFFLCSKLHDFLAEKVMCTDYIVA
jgi:hypothetical protein